MDTNTSPVAENKPPRTLETTEAAANAFLGLLSGKSGEQKPKAPPPAATDEAVATSDAELADASDETPEAEADTESEAPEEGSDEEAAADPEADAEGEAEEPQKFTVTIDGKTFEVTEAELRDGYQRGADYSRKTQALAEERRAFQAEVQQVQQERSQYAQLLPVLAQQIAQALPPQPDPALRQTDPIEYMLQKEQYEEGMQRLVAAQQEMQRIQQTQQAETVQSLRRAVEEGFRKLPDLVPQWRDPKVFQRDQQALREYGRKIGYSDEELDQAYDPRAVAALYKAMRYDQLQSKKPTPQTPLERAVPRPATVRQDVPKPQRELRQARQRLAETGSVDDAARAFRALLG